MRQSELNAEQCSDNPMSVEWVQSWIGQTAMVAISLVKSAKMRRAQSVKL